MKKLTAGIFTVLMGLVTVNAAEAAVASKDYVDTKVGTNTSTIETLTQTVAQNKAAAEKLVNDYKAENDAKVQANTEAIEKNAEDILANTGLISGNTAAISANTTAINNEKTAREQADNALDGRLDTAESDITTLEGAVAALTGGDDSVANQIANALTEAKGYTDTEVKELADGAVKKNADDIAAMDTAYKAADATLQGNIDAMDTAYKAADTALQGNIDTLSGTVSSNKTAADTGIQEAKDAAAAASTAAAQALTDAKAYADQEDAKIESTIGTVPADKTVVGMIAEAQTAATYNDTAIKADIKANADAIDAIEASAYATSGITSEKVTAYDNYAGQISGAQGAADAAQGAADAAQADADAAAQAAAAAQATADAAIPAPTPECSDKGSKCVLTSGENGYAWEVIQRATGEVVE